MANKTDILQQPENAQRLRARAQELGFAYYEISAAALLGVRELVFAVWEELKKLPPIAVYESTFVPQEVTDEDDPITLTVKAVSYTHHMAARSAAKGLGEPMRMPPWRGLPPEGPLPSMPSIPSMMENSGATHRHRSTNRAAKSPRPGCWEW